MKNTLAIIICTLTINGCKNKATQTNDNKAEQFEQLIEKLDEIELPFRINCENCCRVQNID